MRGEAVEAASLGWHGIEGDRRLALRLIEQRGGFPWLTAGKLPDLVLFTPQRRDDGSDEALPSHIRTPEGDELPLFGDALAADIGRRHGAPVQMMHMKHGIFDDASISVITSETVREIGRLAAGNPDVRRFRPNIVVRSTRGVPFEEDEWIGGVLTFGDAPDAPGAPDGPDAPGATNASGPPAVAVTMPDARCAMVNIDPDAGSLAPGVLKAVVRANRNNAGIYATVTRIGRVAVGQPVLLHR